LVLKEFEFMKKVLIIDDSESIRSQLKESLLQNGSFNIVEAEDGEQGYEIAKENQDCNLIIVDLNMPKMGGIELLEALEKNDICLDIPKVIFTTETLKDDKNAKKMKEDGKRLGVKTWFTKPLTDKRITILINTIDQLIKKYN
tara:strand:+ start:8873 stop:9301 length:429 start_codon:yes stop_codon:yes gene_type:complete